MILLMKACQLSLCFVEGTLPLVRFSKRKINRERRKEEQLRGRKNVEMNTKEKTKRTGTWGTEMGRKDQEYRAAKIGKWKSALTFTFPQSSVWAFPFQ